MQITGLVTSHKLNKNKCAFIVVRAEAEGTGDPYTLHFMSDTKDELFAGVRLQERDKVGLSALEANAFVHGATTFYRPYKAHVILKHKPNLGTAEEQNKEVLSSTNTNTKEDAKSTPVAKPPKPKTFPQSIYGRVTKLDLSTKLALLTVLDNHKETGEVLSIKFKDTPKYFDKGMRKPLNNGMRISCNIEKSEDKDTPSIVQSTKATYPDERQGQEEKLVKISYGNARNVAIAAVGAKDLEKMNKLAMDIYEQGKDKREELYKEFSDMDEYDLGAKWGDCLKQAAGEYKSCAKILELGEVLFRNHIEVEDGLLGEGK